MRRLIFQVSVGKPSNLYKWCHQSVSKYCKKYGIDHHIQTEPTLKILPDPKTTNRSQGAIRLGYLPIYEKEHAFTFFDRYEQIAIIDSDIYIRDNAPNIFDSLDIHSDFGGVIERDMPISSRYANKIRDYSTGQYEKLETNHKPNKLGYEFFNMGLMVMNKSIVKYLNGLSPREFIMQKQFKKFVDGLGEWKWSTDQTLLNYWVRKSGMGLHRMDWKWNGLIGAIKEDNIKDVHFLHFYMRNGNMQGDVSELEQLKKLV
jgi:hypothetical protein